MSEVLLSLAALWLVAVVTPGPNMIFFTGLGLSSSGRALAAGGLGILLGTALWGLAGLFGLLWLFEAVPALATAVKVGGGLYLAWIGFRLLRGGLKAREAADDRAPEMPWSPRRAFWTGLATNLSNPKSLVFVTSLFAVTRLAEEPLPVGLTGVALMSLMSATYYLGLGLTLRLTSLGRGGSRLGRVLSMTAGALMMAFGARMAWER